jgi:hypothetical protein
MENQLGEIRILLLLGACTRSLFLLGFWNPRELVGVSGELNHCGVKFGGILRFLKFSCGDWPKLIVWVW